DLSWRATWLPCRLPSELSQGCRRGRVATDGVLVQEMGRTRLRGASPNRALGARLHDGLLIGLRFARGAPFLEALNDHEHRWHEEDGKTGRGDHAAEDRYADGFARRRTGARCEHQ